jgi:hypothetical protein
MPGANPSADRAILAALKWEAAVRSALTDGTPVPKPPRSPAYSDDDILRAVLRPGSLATEPLEIVREAIEALGAEVVEALSDKRNLLDVEAKKAAHLTIAAPGLEALTPDQSAELSAAIRDGNIPAALLSNADLPDSVRLAVARSVPEHFWTEAAEHDRLYGSPDDTGDAGTEGAE